MAAPFILSRRVHGANPSTSDFTSGRLAIGTGPYRLVSFAQNERMELRRNDTYWGPAEPWDRVTVRFIPQAAARSAALLAGEVDLIDYVPVQDVENFRRDARFALFEGDSVTFVYLAPDAMRDTSPFVADRAGNPLPRNPLADRRAGGAVARDQPRARRSRHGSTRASDARRPVRGTHRRTPTAHARALAA